MCISLPYYTDCIDVYQSAITHRLYWCVSVCHITQTVLMYIGLSVRQKTDICVAFTFDSWQHRLRNVNIQLAIFSSENGQKVLQVVNDDRRPTINFGCSILPLSSVRENAFEPKNLTLGGLLGNLCAFFWMATTNKSAFLCARPCKIGQTRAETSCLISQREWRRKSN